MLERPFGIDTAPPERRAANAAKSVRRECSAAVAFTFVLLTAAAVDAQSSATLQGRVFDGSGAVISGAIIRIGDGLTGFERSVRTDDEGRYFVGAIPAGSYTLTAGATGFKSQVVETFRFEVGRTLVYDFRLDVGDHNVTVVVNVEVPPIDRATTAVSHVVSTGTVQQIPLNGRHFIDLGLLVPGSVAPSQTGFSTTPIRGLGALAVNTAGNREEAVGFLVNGVTANNRTFGSLGFEIPLASIQEFKVENSVFSPENGHVSGGIVNIATRSGTNDFRGEVFEFFRNEALDARNFFEFTSDEPHLFERHQFGGSMGGPIVRDRAFFFTTYEGLRQRQDEDMNSLVLSDAQRSAATDPAVRRLIELIPRANFVDPGGTPRFVGSARALVNTDRWTADLRHQLTGNDQLHAFYGWQRIRGREPSWMGSTIPGFGRVLRSELTILTLGATHVFGPALLNEARAGRTTLSATSAPGTMANPADFGIRNGVARPIGLPQLVVAGGLNFGGPGVLPAGRDDNSWAFSDTLSFVTGRHSLRVGGEYRHFDNRNVAEGTGSFNFPTVSTFLAGVANAFSITLGERKNHIDLRAAGLFVHDRIRLRSDLNVELGLRYEWHVTPTERDDQFVVFDAETSSLLRVGVDIDRIYRQNDRNFEPRLGIAWDTSGNGRTVVRAAYGLAVDEPSTSAVSATAANPPFATPLSAVGAIPLGTPLTTAQYSLLAPATVDPFFRNSSLHSWNVNGQQKLGKNIAALIGYFGSKGRHLRIGRNLNQPINGIRPFPALSDDSPILPGTPLGNITQIESTGFSTYHALWLSASKRMSQGLQFDASYTLSKSLDTNSLNSFGFAVQNSYDIPNQYGLSDFDARHRFVLSALYDLPFAGHALTRGWQLAAIVQSQSGNPVNIVTGNATLTGVPNTIRPQVTGPIRIIGSVDQWFDPSVFVEVDRFGNLGRNVVIGPSFHNTDVSVIRNFGRGRVRVQLRVDIFDLFNHPNLGPPGNLVGSPTFGRITRTRLLTGEAGSSRQIQLVARLVF